MNKEKKEKSADAKTPASDRAKEATGQTELPDLRRQLDELCEREGYKGGLSTYMEYRTSRVIQFATDTWGNRDKTHLELRLLGRTLQIDFDKDRVRFGGFFEFKQTAINAFELHPWEVPSVEPKES